MTIFLLCKFLNDGPFVKRCVIKNHDTSRSYFFKQVVFKPKFKQYAIGSTHVFHRRNPLTLTNSCNNIDSLELFAADFCDNLLPTRRISILSVQVFINTAFVDIYKPLCRKAFQLLNKGLSKSFVTFFVKGRFFYAVSLNV